MLTVQGLGGVGNPESHGEEDLYSGSELQLHVPARNSSPPPGPRDGGSEELQGPISPSLVTSSGKPLSRSGSNASVS